MSDTFWVKLDTIVKEILTATQVHEAFEEQGRTIEYGGSVKVFLKEEDSDFAKVATVVVTITGGSVSLNLQALDHHLDQTVNLDTLKPKLIRMEAYSTNTSAVVVEDGASNGAAIWGSGNDISLAPGTINITYLRDAAEGQAVGNSNKTLDITGTNGDKIVFLFVYA